MSLLWRLPSMAFKYKRKKVILLLPFSFSHIQSTRTVRRRPTFILQSISQLNTLFFSLLSTTLSLLNAGHVCIQEICRLWLSRGRNESVEFKTMAFPLFREITADILDHWEFFLLYQGTDIIALERERETEQFNDKVNIQMGLIASCDYILPHILLYPSAITLMKELAQDKKHMVTCVSILY